LFNLDIWRGVEMDGVSKTKQKPRPKKTKQIQEDSPRSANGSFFKGDSILRVIGFIADMIAILSVLFAICVGCIVIGEEHLTLKDGQRSSKYLW
jgi:hypothetical protein